MRADRCAAAASSCLSRPTTIAMQCAARYRCGAAERRSGESKSPQYCSSPSPTRPQSKVDRTFCLESVCFRPLIWRHSRLRVVHLLGPWQQRTPVLQRCVWLRGIRRRHRATGAPDTQPLSGQAAAGVTDSGSLQHGTEQGVDVRDFGARDESVTRHIRHSKGNSLAAKRGSCVLSRRKLV